MDSIYEVPGTVERNSGLLDAGRRLFAAVWEHAEIRVELFAAELAEERSRAVNALILAGFLVVLAALAGAFLGVGLLVAAWETEYRLWVAAALPIVFAVGAFICWMLLQRLTGRDSPLFRHSLAEWKKDVKAMRNPPESPA